MSPRPKPFRFGVQEHSAPSAKAWRDTARLVESLGYKALYLPDHFGHQLGPIAALAAAADATTTLRVGSLVFDNDYRHPVVLAKEVASAAAARAAIGPDRKSTPLNSSHVRI